MFVRLPKRLTRSPTPFEIGGHFEVRNYISRGISPEGYDCATGMDCKSLTALLAHLLSFLYSQCPGPPDVGECNYEYLC